MYQYFFFALSILGVYSIIENLKQNQNFTRLKIHILLILGVGSLLNFLYFLSEIGFEFLVVKSIARIVAMIIFSNLLFLIAKHKIPKVVLFMEGVLFIFYIIIIYNGFHFSDLKGGLFKSDLGIMNQLAVLPSIIFLLTVMLYNLIFIFTNSDVKNQYHLKVRYWVKLLVIMFIPFLLLFIFSILSYFNLNLNFTYVDSKFAQIFFGNVIVLFILMRPKFLDESGYILKFSDILPKANHLSISKFELMFFGNLYFLNTNASIEDFALKMNHSKNDINNFIKSHFEVSFNELLNKNRVSYFKELLKSNQQDSFTIEALAEMSGFSNRQGMYVAFKKFENSTPREYINSL